MDKTYRQITRKLRLRNGVSERPSQTVKGIRVYTDDENPTLVTFDEQDAVNIPFLLSIGAIAEYKPPKVEIECDPPKVAKEVPSAQNERTSK